MGQQKIAGAFRSQPPGGLFLQDTISSNQRTLGATIIDVASVTVPIGQIWTIVSWTIFFQGAIDYVSHPIWAAFGKIIGGLIVDGATPTLGDPGNNQPWDTGLQPFPPDVSMLQTLWDGNTDPPFPPLTFPNPQPVSVVSGSMQLPVPVVIHSSVTLGIGIWLTPSLEGGSEGAIISLLNGQYTIVLDDGQQPQGWIG